MNINLKKLARENVRALTPYASARDEFRGTASLYLDANENPFPSGYHRYPDARQQQLKAAVAKLKGVSPDQLLITHGSDEGIDLLIRAFCTPGKDTIIIPQPTYGMYATYAAIQDVTVRPVALDADFDLDVDAVKSAIRPATKMIFLCSPNNPSGNLLSIAKVKSVLRVFSGLVVMDEAYIDFTGSAGWLSELRNYRNLVVLHTFSKAWGLAGLRMGVCMADPEVIGYLMKIKPPYNISTFSERKLLQEIARNGKRTGRHVAILIREREKMARQLAGLPVVQHVYPSQANFLLVQVTDASSIYKDLIRRGIVIRNRSGILHCENCLRITIGTPAQNQRLLNALKTL